MSQSGNDTFALVISFFNALWQPCHMTIGLFTIERTMGNTTAEQMKHLLGSFGLLNKVIAFVKDEGINTTLKSIVFCDMLDLPTPFIGTCWGHTMSKVA